ncbi:MAG: zinc-dependent alcohol dehydrogenase family protein [Proteobacteria bacterium]|nr:zinc-dependent alcohol dehydrogenase family protein [Pseudomonadota bacterium]MDA0995005.1 zinc-dependent alcohol dehydrogenase family protein [Pseudomonadota bacterium]
MKAAVYDEFRGPVELRTVDDPDPGESGAVLKVAATGVCRSDWHGWMGHDKDIALPHVPGHELAGTVEAVGSLVKSWRRGDRVTVPFVCGCGTCDQCSSGNHQICDNQTQPGFTHWGSYAEYVKIDYADTNLVALPESVDFVTAASLGCRFATSFRAIVAQGNVAPEKWVAVHGCGGVGLSAVMIAAAFDAHVIAIDINDEVLQMAKMVGATATINAKSSQSVVSEVRELSSGGVHLSLDALGTRETCLNSIANLRKRGRHIQVGLMVGDDYHPSLPMELVIANELEIVGSHGMQAFEYERMLRMIESGKLQPHKLVRQTVSLERAASTLGNPGDLQIAGVTVINQF